MRAIEEIRDLELVEFERDGRCVLFHPETLCFFRLNPRAARLIRDVRQGAGVEEVGRAHKLDPEQLERALDAILAPVRASGRSVSRANTGSRLKQRGTLPKAVLMVNNYCNLKCTYCYEHQNVFTRKPIDMPLEIARTAIDKVYGAFESVDTWMFIGGEPTLSETVIEFACRHAIEAARRNEAPKPGFGMISNGVRMTDRLFELIREFEIQVTFSLDGPKKVNDLVRIRHDGSGSFDGVMENIRRYREVFPDQAQVECTVTQAHRDAGLSLTEVLDFCARDLGVAEPHIAAAGLAPDDPLNPHRGGGLGTEFLAAAEASMDALLQPGESAGGKLDLVADMVQRLAHRTPIALMCPAGISQVVVDSFGDIYPCWMFAGAAEHAMGNILRDELRGPKALGVIGRIEANSKTANPACATCYARGVCSCCVGNNHNASGKIENPSPAFCNTVRGTLRVVVERLAAASQAETAAAAAGVSGQPVC
jgi:uncharacterized protein